MDYQSAIDLYTNGSCHVFAMASVRQHGGSYLIVEDYAETWWEFEDGDCQNAVVHVYAVHDTPDGPIARDIHGDRPLHAVLEEVSDRFRALEPTYNGGVSCEDDLMDLIEGPHDRSTDMDPPLSEFSEADIKRAIKWVDWLPFLETEKPVRTDLLDPLPSADEPAASLAF